MQSYVTQFDCIFLLILHIFIADRKFAGSNLDQLRKKATEMGLTRRGSLERKSSSDKRSSWSSDDLSTSFDTFRPVTLTISNFFKQVLSI